MSSASQLPQPSQSSYPASAMAAPGPMQNSFTLPGSLPQRGAGALDLHEMENRKLRHKLSKLEREHEELKRVYMRLSLWTKEKSSISGQELYSFLQNTEVLQPHDHTDLGQEEVAAPDVAEPGGGRFFELFQDLEGTQGHQGPVYTCRFSRRGNLLATGSFDKTVKLWRLENGFSCETFQEHLLNVSDLGWSGDDSFLVSGGYDKTVKCYDVQGLKFFASWDLAGFVLSVLFSPLDDNLIWAGTSQSTLHLIDRRVAAPVVTVKNEPNATSMVNALDMPVGPGWGFKLLSGDSRGMLKTWDARSAESSPLCESAVRNGEGKPISDVNSSVGPSAEEGSLLAVNSYDDAIRVYHRPAQGQDGQVGPGSLRLQQTLLGHRNKNFPIRSSLYRGSRYTSRPAATLSPESHPQASAHAASQLGGVRAGVERSLILATGSADKSCYIFDVSNQQVDLVQKLEGHSDRVYCASFHPAKPLLATASADHRVKLWLPTAR